MNDNFLRKYGESKETVSLRGFTLV